MLFSNEIFWLIFPYQNDNKLNLFDLFFDLITIQKRIYTLVF